jgi:PiT family inorganic phosphate transporter
VPLWVKVSCGVAIAAGTFIGGWRIIDTMGNRLTEIEAPPRRRGRHAPARCGASMIPASSFIDFDALWKIVAAGFAGGAGVVLAFGFVLLGRSRHQDAGEGTLGRGLPAAGDLRRHGVRRRAHRRLHRDDQDLAIDNPRAEPRAN